MILFKKIKFKNFGSFGNNYTEIDLEKNNTTLIYGKNGSGKSFALLDSITFALFGKSFRKINIPQLANSVNQKECIVELLFDIGNDQYKIRRGLSPKLFEIYRNDALINQDAKSSDYQDILEQQILRMNYKTFTQVVILGSSSFVPFMQLSAADRRTVIENILDINIFATMNSVVKSKITETKESIKDVEYEIELTKNKIEAQHKLIRLSKESSGIDIEQTKKNLENVLSEKEKLDTQFKLESAKESEQFKIIDGLKPKISVIEKQIDQLNYKTESLEDEKSFYENETSCPKCKGKISKETKKENIENINQIIYENRQKVSTFEYDLQGLKQTLNGVSIERKSADISNQINIVNFKVNSYEKDIKRYEDIEKTLTSHKGDLDKLNVTMVELDQKKVQQKENLEYLSYATDLLKDSGVKSKIIKYYLPTMNKYINKYLSSMNFNIKFTLDEEFNETIKSRYRDDFSYMNFSEGEKMRIDLALLLSWREIAKLKNSVNCNLLILDEVFDSSLDGVGTDDVLRLLNTLGSNANVFVISHKADQISDKFKATMTFEKKGNFSKLVK